jgi:hypothetical protein
MESMKSAYHGSKCGMQTIVSRQSKIGNLDRLITIHENILGLQISMDDIVSMEKVNPLENLKNNPRY